MKLALIPPLAHLDMIWETNYHLMLAQLVSNEDYAQTLKALCIDPDHYVILDNGAAEGQQVTDDQLLTIAWEYNVNELVIPDVLGDWEETEARAETFLDKIDNEWGVRLMFVCQGQSVEQFIASALYASDLVQVDTIGIPRHALRTCNDRLARIKIANELQRTEGFNKQIHFLGSAPSWPIEPKYLADRYITEQRLVRGFDTSMPFNYAFENRLIRDKMEVARPEGYFDRELTTEQLHFAHDNITTLKWWTHAR